MPRIETLKVWRFLFVAWAQDDYGNRHFQRVGLTEQMAIDRCINAVYPREG